MKRKTNGMRFNALSVAVLLAGELAAPHALPYSAITIPTRDGKSLAADLYALDTTAAKPVILIQTPYNKNLYRTRILLYQAGGILFPMDSVSYNYVVLDWRGFYGSTAAAVANYDRGLDGYDAVEWIARRQWCNGRVGTFGGSALGMIQFQTAKHHPPHLVCCLPMVKDYKTKYSDYFFGGDFRKEHVVSLDSLGFIPVSTILAHPTYDVYWQAVERSTDYPESLAVPMFLISGWYDHFPDAVLRAFHDMRQRSDPPVRSVHRLLMGPWEHGGIGALNQGALQYPQAVGMPDSMILSFFARYLKGGQNGWESGPIVTYFQMGTNAWHTTADWSLTGVSADTLFLGAGRVLQDSPAAGSQPADSFVYDPRNPTPALGGSRFNPFDASVLVGPQDLSTAIESRADVLVYSTPVLDNDLTIDGPVRLEISVSNDRTDTDLSARLCDVFPDGKSMIMQQGIRRMRFRDSFSTAALMTPGTVYTAQITFPDLALTIVKGHRLRIDVAGADYPHFDLNLNNGGTMYAAGDTLAATIRVMHDAQNQSRVILPLAGGSAPARGNRPSPRSHRAMIAVVKASLPTHGGPGSVSPGVRIYDLTGRAVRLTRGTTATPGASVRVVITQRTDH